jgi:myo-inositol-1(or 4)-monophosphatase
MNTPLDLAACLDAAVEAARRGADQLEAWRKKFRVREKSRADLVTDADTASQKAVKDHLLGRFPDFLFVGEEECVGKPIDATRPVADAPPVWVVDPLDGTANYVHDVPAYCVSIGLWAGGKAVVGVIYDPRMNELFTAADGRGAFLNGQPIRVSTTPSLRDSLLSTGFPAGWAAQQRNLAAWQRVSEHAQALRRTGSTALNMAYVAAGRFDGYWAFDNWPWDVLGGAALIQEAGGKLTATDGTPFDPFRPDLISTNGLIQKELTQALGG